MNEHAFELHGVHRRFSHFHLSDINLTLQRGGIMGLIGPNGAGKSTTLRILMGLLAADSGRVRLMGHDLPAQQVPAKREVGFASEDMRLYKHATLQWHMDFVRAVFPDRWDADYAKTLLKRFDLIADQKIKGLSHGQRVKAGLLLILARRPGLLILDEPTTGLDPVARKEVLNEMMAVLADDERSVLFSSHNTQDVEQLSDCITFIDRGRIVSSDDTETFMHNWCRVRLHGEAPVDLPNDARIKEVIRLGQQTALIVHRCDDALINALTAAGAQVQATEPLSLEEIFVAEVEAKRAGEMP